MIIYCSKEIYYIERFIMKGVFIVKVDCYVDIVILFYNLLNNCFFFKGNRKDRFIKFQIQDGILNNYVVCFYDKRNNIGSIEKNVIRVVQIIYGIELQI